jgi:hypothetical protein
MSKKRTSKGFKTNESPLRESGVTNDLVVLMVESVDGQLNDLLADVLFEVVNGRFSVSNLLGRITIGNDATQVDKWILMAMKDLRKHRMEEDFVLRIIGVGKAMANAMSVCRELRLAYPIGYKVTVDLYYLKIVTTSKRAGTDDYSTTKVIPFVLACFAKGGNIVEL